MNKVPVVAVVHRGNYLRAPFWDFRRKRKVPLHTTLTQILTAEQVQSMTADEITAYLQTGESFGKAGAYAVQGYAARFITGIEGDYFNVVGLPVRRLYATLKQEFDVTL